MAATRLPRLAADEKIALAAALKRIIKADPLSPRIPLLAQIVARLVRPYPPLDPDDLTRMLEAAVLAPPKNASSVMVSANAGESH